jgi:methionyl aminopeptidase
MVVQRSAAEIAAMREAGRIVAAVLTAVAGAAKPGVRLSDLDTAMHEDPPVPNTGRANRGLPLYEGLVIAIEPMLIEGGGDGYRTRADGWTVTTADGSRAAHEEHTVAITAGGPVVLTVA